MIVPDATCNVATSSLLRPFRFGDLSVGGAAPADGISSAAGTCDVWLALDLAGRADASLEERLLEARHRIGQDGVVLLALPNRFGLRFWAGCPEPATGRLFTTLAGPDETGATGKGRFVSRRELVLALDRTGLEALEWYIAVPDPHETGTSGSLLSEHLVAAAPELAADLAWARPSADRLRPRLDLFAEALVGRELARAGLFMEFGSHFLVAAASKRGRASESTWPRLRPRPREAGWHYAAGRREPIETVFELGPEGVVVDKRRLAGDPPAEFGEFRWTPGPRSPLAPGEPFRFHLQASLAAGKGAEFLQDLDAFFAATAQRFQPAGEACVDRFSGEALDALVTNATRTSDGTFHYFDLEWCARTGVPVSWWILRNVAACREMFGPRLPGSATGSELYALLCHRIGVQPGLDADLAREAAFAAIVRSADANDPLALPTALAQPWPAPMAQGLEPTELRSATELAAEHRSLVAAYRELETWAIEAQTLAANVQSQYRLLENRWSETLAELEALRLQNRQLSSRLSDLGFAPPDAGGTRS